MIFLDTIYSDLTNKTYNNNIIVNNMYIDSLKGSPKIVKGDFNINENLLSTLEYCPKKIEGNFYCIGNNLNNLDFFPTFINNSIYLNKNKLKNLVGLPKKIKGDFYCNNNDLRTLKGNLKEVSGTFDCSDNKNLKNVKEQIIKYQIKAFMYYTDEGDFSFEDIKEIFKLGIKQKKFNNIDYGYGI